MSRNWTTPQQTTPVSIDDLTKRGDGKILLFHPGVKFILPQAGKPFAGRIMPARDPYMAVTDSAWKDSVFPYRDKSVVDDKNEKNLNNPAFTAFYSAAMGYRFLGHNQLSFMSPTTLRLYGVSDPTETADPVIDINAVARKSDTWRHFTEKVKVPGQKFDKSPWPYKPSTFILMNWYGQNPRTSKTETTILVINTMALERLLHTDLCAYSPRSQEPIDPQWADFLYGDITNPETGLWVTVRMLTSDTGSEFPGFQLAQRANSLEGVTKFPIPRAVLGERYDLKSPNVIRIETYQAIVDLIREDGMIPHALIKEACGNNANVGSSPAMGIPSPLPGPLPPPDDDDIPMQHSPGAQTYPMPAQAAGPPPIQEAAPLPPPVQQAPLVPQGLFWVTVKGSATPMPDKQSGAQVMALLGANQSILVCAVGREAEGWKPAVEFGFVLQPPAVAGPPPTPAAQEAAPLPPPVQQAPPVLPSSAAEVSAAWTAEEEKELVEIMSRREIKSGQPGAISAEEMVKASKLVSKRTAAGISAPIP